MDDSSGNIDQQLLNDYRMTVYQITEFLIAIKIGQANPALEILLEQQNASTWAFVTAWNPKSVLLSQIENETRHQALIKWVEQENYLYFNGKGMGSDKNWEPEISLFILNIPKAKAVEIGKYFNQNAMVFGQKGDLPELLIL